jgi:hypothetical protein
MLLDELEEELKRRRTPTPNEKIFYPSYQKGEYKRSKIPVVKNISSLGAMNTKNALHYIVKNTPDGLLNSKDGDKINVEDKFNEWKKDFSLLENSKEALHLVFSIDENKNSKNFEALEKSVVDTLKQNFFEYDYVYVLHTTQGKPHAHVILNKRNIYTKKKIHFNTKDDCRNFYGKLKSDFADNLNFYNREFNYKPYYKVDKDLILNLAKEEIKKTNNKDNIIKILSNEALKNKDSYSKIIDDTNKSIYENIISNNNAIKSKDKSIIKNQLDNLKFLKNKLNNFKRLEKNTTAHLKNIDFVKEQLNEDNLIDIEKVVKYFNSPAQKRLMSLSAVKILAEIEKDFKDLKFAYDKDISNLIKDDKFQIEYLSNKTNAFKIHKLYTQILKRKFANDFIVNNPMSGNRPNYELPIYSEKVKIQLDENIKNIKDLFVIRTDKVEILLDKALKQLEFENLPENKIESLKKSIAHYKRELDFINKISLNDNDMNINLIDTNRFIKELTKKVKLLDSKSSAYKIMNLYNEAVARENRNENLSSYSNLNTHYNNVKIKLDDLKSELKILFNERDTQNINYLNNLNKVINYVPDDKKDEIIEKIDWLKKERNLIVEARLNIFNKEDKREDKELFVIINKLNDNSIAKDIIKGIEAINNQLNIKKDDKELLENKKYLYNILNSRNSKVDKVLTGLKDKLFDTKLSLGAEQRESIKLAISRFKEEKALINAFNNKTPNIKNINITKEK